MKQYTYSTTTGELQRMYMESFYNKFLCNMVLQKLIGTGVELHPASQFLGAKIDVIPVFQELFPEIVKPGKVGRNSLLEEFVVEGGKNVWVGAFREGVLNRICAQYGRDVELTFTITVDEQYA